MAKDLGGRDKGRGEESKEDKRRAPWKGKNWNKAKDSDRTYSRHHIIIEKSKGCTETGG